MRKTLLTIVVLMLLMPVYISTLGSFVPEQMRTVASAVLEPHREPYSVQQVSAQAPLSDADTRRLLSSLDLHYERFLFNLPKQENLMMFERVFERGEEITPLKSRGRVALDSGMEDVLLTMKEADDELSFKFFGRGAALGFGGFRTHEDDCGGVTRMWRAVSPKRLTPGTPQPIFYVASDEDGVSGDDIKELTEEMVLEMAGTYDHLIVLYVDLDLDEQPAV